jgi:hypothetical protein
MRVRSGVLRVGDGLEHGKLGQNRTLVIVLVRDRVPEVDKHSVAQVLDRPPGLANFSI